MGDAVEITAVARGHRVSKVVSHLVVIGSISAAMASLYLAHYFVPRGAILLAYVVAAAIVVGAASFIRWGQNVRILASRDGIVVGGRRVPRSEIDSANVVKQGERTVLVLSGAGIEIETDERMAKRLRATLELDAGHRVAKYQMPGRLATAIPLLSNAKSYRLVVLAWMLPVMAAWTKLHWIPKEAAWALIAVGCLFMGLLIQPSSLEVGADGFTVGWLGTRRYVAFADVVSTTDAKRYGMATRTFALRDGTSFHVVSGTDMNDPVLARIREAMDVESTTALPNQALLLERGKRSAREWLDHLRAMGSGAAATLRSADLDLDSLWIVLDDPKAKTSARIAAAVALAGRGGEDVSERLRVTTEASAAPRLRVAVEATAKGDDAALLAAIQEEIAEEEDAARRKA